MRKLGFLILLLIPLLEKEAFTSKYIGPRSAEVRCKVVATLKEAPSTGTLEWDPKGAPEAVLVEARPAGIIAFDDNGWANNKQMVPAPIYVKVPETLAKKGSKLLVHLEFGPKYDGKSMVGSVVRSRPFLEHTGKPGVTKEAAFHTAGESGFSATWSRVALIGGNWHVSGYSKSAMPPMYFVVDGADGLVIFRNRNSDVDQLPEEFTGAKPTEKWDLMNDEWHREK